MKNFWNSYRPSVPSKLVYVVIILALFGLIDAVYLTATHYSGEAVSCSVLRSCEQVLNSKYSTFVGVPVAAFGVVYYVSLFLLAYYYNLTGNKVLWRLLQIVIIIGVIVTAGLIYLQLAVIHAICQYCMLSAILTTAMASLILSMSIRNRANNENQKSI